MHRISMSPLTPSDFAPFGEVIDSEGFSAITINQGFAQRFDDVAQIDVASAAGSTNVSLFTARTRPFPIEIRMMERHPLGSQLFYPLQEKPWLVVVCTDPRSPASYRAFLAQGHQGVNYARNTWHHPLLVLSDMERFLVIDRKGPGENLEEATLDDRHALVVVLPG